MLTALRFVFATHEACGVCPRRETSGSAAAPDGHERKPYGGAATTPAATMAVAQRRSRCGQRRPCECSWSSGTCGLSVPRTGVTCHGRFSSSVRLAPSTPVPDYPTIHPEPRPTTQCTAEYSPNDSPLVDIAAVPSAHRHRWPPTRRSYPDSHRPQVTECNCVASPFIPFRGVRGAGSRAAGTE